MAIKPVSTPLRRSRRGQPIAAIPLDASTSKASINTHDPVFKRMTRTEDLYPEDIEALNEREIPIEDLETHFYDRLVRDSGPSAKSSIKAYGKKKQRRKSQTVTDDTYHIGDTVQIKSSAREPSIAVIVAIWSIIGPEIQPTVRVLIHWFLTASDLPRVRAARTHVEVSHPNPCTT